MLALAGYPLGLRFRFLDPAPDAPMHPLAEQIVGAYDDAAALDRFVDGLDVVTYEFENVPVAAARHLAQHAPVYPPLHALEVAQDRLHEKTFFQRLGIPTPPFAPVDTRADLEAALERIGLPAVLKTRRLGYDGKGQALLRGQGDVVEAWRVLGGAPLILEGFVDFLCEVSIIAARGRDGSIVYYPLIENEHHAGILRRSLVPAPSVTPALQTQAEQYAARVLEALDYVGVLAIELFLAQDGGRRAEDGGRDGETRRQGDKETAREGEVEGERSGGWSSIVGGRLAVNEMAPRVHNSGHWTIEGAETSQFTNHLRAVLGLPPGSTALRGHAAMLNLIGTLPDQAAILATPGAHLHLYGKQPRPGRKLGHITVRADDAQTLAQRIDALQRLISES
jgi:5-(carboxyamino)imidazole ribonucleotide synthase